jgi:hypothetical protein
VTDEGSNLSFGQRQLFCLARMVPWLPCGKEFVNFHDLSWNSVVFFNEMFMGSEGMFLDFNVILMRSFGISIGFHGSVW